MLRLKTGGTNFVWHKVRNVMVLLTLWIFRYFRVDGHQDQWGLGLKFEMILGKRGDENGSWMR